MTDLESEFSNFLNTIEDMDFLDGFAKTQKELSSAEPIARNELRKPAIQQNYQRIKYAKQLKELAFWFHSCMKPAGLTNEEFLLIKPLCIKLVDKGQLKNSALSFFNLNQD